jgi:hypothetical protein
LLHILPDHFVRIRHYGFFANRHRTSHCRELLGAEPSATEPEEPGDWQTIFVRVPGQDPTLCPECGRGHLRLVQKLASLAGRSPP